VDIKQKVVNKKKIFPLEIMGYHNRVEQAKGHSSENERAQIKKGCKLRCGVKVKRRKANGHQNNGWVYTL
jgi:hypothetical protein